MIGIHITVALLSILFTTLALFWPTRAKLNVSYGLAGATLATGVFLVVAAPAHMLQACVAGVVYIAVAFPLIALARRRFIYKLATHK